MVTAFIATYAALFNEWPANQFTALESHFYVSPARGTLLRVLRLDRSLDNIV